MKIKSLVNTVGILGSVAFLACTPAKAGEMMVMPMDTGPIELTGMDNLLDPIETSLSVGFDTHYMFRGFDLGQEAVWAGIDFSLPISSPLGNFSVDFGAWYVNPTEGPNNSGAATATVAPPLVPGPAFNVNPKRGIPDDELDLYLGVSTTVGPIDVAVGYVHYFLGPEQSLAGIATGANDQNEFGTSLGTSVGPVDLGFKYAYNLDAGDATTTLPGLTAVPGVWQFTHFWEPSVGTGFEVTDRVSLNFSAAFGFYGNKYSYYQLGLAAPIIIADNVVLEPYVAYMDNNDSVTIGGESPSAQDTFFGGVSLRVSF